MHSRYSHCCGLDCHASYGKRGPCSRITVCSQALSHQSCCYGHTTKVCMHVINLLLVVGSMKKKEASLTAFAHRIVTVQGKDGIEHKHENGVPVEVER